MHIRDSFIDCPCDSLFSTCLCIVSSVALCPVEIVLIDGLVVSFATSLRTSLLSNVLVIQSLTTIFGLFSQRVNAFHVCLKQVIFVLDAVLDQVLKLFHLDLDDDFIDIGIGALFGFNIGCTCICVQDVLPLRTHTVSLLSSLGEAISQCCILLS